MKGAVATAAIEGNTLTENEVHAIREEGKQLPPSQQYLQQEIDNVIAALEEVDKSARSGEPLKITTEWIKQKNAQILHGLDVDDHVTPGEFTTTSLTVGSVYRGAPPEDVPFLMDRLCDWLNQFINPLDSPDTTPDHRFFCSFFAAVIGHLYIAWIHPFGDGNGRTARILECALLAHSGVVPWVASNLLSDHYNRTRSRYYQKLDAASKRGDVSGFVTYSAQGFVDMLREAISDVQGMQRRTAWVNFIHERFQDESPGNTQQRRRLLTLTLKPGDPTPRRKIRHLSPQLAELYAGKEDKTVTRDLNRLQELGLIRREASGYVPNIEIMDAFIPGNSQKSI
ncbi:Fic family protein [Haloechinothrix salitolerans]|uniref:Fic family protein n=1 Tax=Haloechinothrix salitolerans TaxID=926830 RepID=A0ABW2BXZ1_9PSEU